MAEISTTDRYFMTEGCMEPVDDEVQALCLGMLRDAKGELELFVTNSETIKFENKVSTFKPLLQVLCWMADPDRVGAPGVTFGQCCDYLGIQKDVVMKNYKEILANAHPNGIRELKRYVGLFVSSPRLQREHYKPSRRKNPT